MTKDSELLRQYRAISGDTQIEAAARLGISDATIKSVETGRRSLSPQVRAYLECFANGEMSTRDTALSLLTKSAVALKNGAPATSVRLAYTAIVIITR